MMTKVEQEFEKNGRKKPPVTCQEKKKPGMARERMPHSSSRNIIDTILFSSVSPVFQSLVIRIAGS
jgi:hypothetical protein